MVRAPDKKASARDLIEVTEDLAAVLERQLARDATVLDEKLADYVFFPLSNVLRHQQHYPIRLTEGTVKCLRILVQHGWKSNISKELSQQLLILLTFIAGGLPVQDRRPAVPEETTLEALHALAAVLQATGASAAGAASLTASDALPALGHTITVVLEATTGGNTPSIQLQALQALEAILAAIRDAEALATFLPGIVSSLTKLLTAPVAPKTSRKVLAQGVAAMKSALVGVLADVKVRNLTKALRDGNGEAHDGGRVLTASWLRASADQIKLALSNVLKLRNHNAPDVREALEKFCITLLDECHQSLANCTVILVESAMVLSAEEENRSLLSSGLNTGLTDLAVIYPELTETVKSTVYNWVTSLPRIMQSSDGSIKRLAIQNLMKGQRLMNTLRIDSSTLHISLASSLRDSVTALITAGQPRSQLTEVNNTDLISSSGSLVLAADRLAFQPTLLSQPTQKDTREDIIRLVSAGGPFLHQTKLTRDILDFVRESTGNTQVASYWLAFELVKSGLAQSSAVDEFLDFSSAGEPADEHEYLLQELYSYSVAVLDAGAEADEADWRAQALALEVTTFAATRMGLDFRPELIDVLYPTATFLGSNVVQLRDHAIVALNNIAAACGYANVTDLVVDNADYMLNSISLRLNTFDISPASTQVLRMMVRLTGPKLIPFLDDVVASIFAALDNYHGYTMLVESLFSVLAEIVNQGAKSDLLLLEDASRPKTDRRKRAAQAASIQEISGLLDQRAERKRRREREDDSGQREVFPKKPWKEEDPKGADGGDEDDLDGANQEMEKKPLPKTPTYTLLTRITDLTQHYLTSPTPTLRKSLLDLLTIVCPALSPDEDSFLPVVNSIWPVLLARLYDPEPFVVTAACQALGALFASAGDFLSTRIKTEWWDGLGQWCAKAKDGSRAGRNQRHALTGRGPGGVAMPIRSSGRGLLESGTMQEPLPPSLVPAPRAGLGEFRQAAQVWDAVRGMLVALVSFVRVDDAVFEQILVLLADELPATPGAREALEAVNADAVWLAMYEGGYGQRPQEFRRPSLEGVQFVEV